jgi:hypothetical protein
LGALLGVSFGVCSALKEDEIMQITSPMLSAARAVGACVLLTGCTGTSAGPAAALPGDVARSLTSTVEAAASTACVGAPCGNLYVSDLSSDSVHALLNRKYTPNGSIPATAPSGEWTDAKYNLYVTNFTGRRGFVQERACTAGREAQCERKPSFIYSRTLIDPTSVTTDRSGNVYVTDQGVGGIDEFPQGVNKHIESCAILGFPQGVAVDSRTGDVFMSYYSVERVGRIMVFKGGLVGCHGANLNVHLKFAAGMILDPRGNLIVADTGAKTVDVIAPPYADRTRTCGSGYGGPSQVALTASGARLFVADPANADVQVYNYPACTLVRALSGSSVGVPAGVTNTYNLVD